MADNTEDLTNEQIDDSEVRKGKLKDNYIVTKYDPILLMKEVPFNLTELKLMDAYLSRINPNDPSVTCVDIALEDFVSLTGIQSKVNRKWLSQNTRDLLQKIVTIPIGDDLEYEQFQLFSRCRCIKNERGEYYIRIQCHEDAKQFFFRGPEQVRFIKYAFGNIRKLRSKYGVLLFLYIIRDSLGCKVNKWEIPINSLRDEWFKLEDKPAYKDYRYFKRDILSKAVDDINEHTSINCTYKPIKNGKFVASIEFTVYQRKSIDDTDTDDINADGNKDSIAFEEEYDEGTAELAIICHNEFPRQDVKKIKVALEKKIPSDCDNVEERQKNHLIHCYEELCKQDGDLHIKSRIAYLLKLIELRKENWNSYGSSSSSSFPEYIEPNPYKQLEPEIQPQEQTKPEIDPEQYNEDVEYCWNCWIYKRSDSDHWTSEEDEDAKHRISIALKERSVKQVLRLIYDTTKINGHTLRFHLINYLSENPPEGYFDDIPKPNDAD